MLRKLYVLLLSILFIIGCKTDRPANYIPEKPKKIDEVSATVDHKKQDYLFSVKWDMLSQRAIDRAKKEDKIMIIFFYSESCRDCGIMMLSTFSYPEVVNLLNDHFVPVMADIVRYHPVATAMLNGDLNVPAMMFIPPNDTWSMTKKGYVSPFELQDILKSYLSEIKSGKKIRSYGNHLVEIE